MIEYLSMEGKSPKGDLECIFLGPPLNEEAL
jgi:hypothetical protein